MARILVTGADGFVGAALSAHLQARGHVVRGAVRQTQGPDRVATGDITTFQAWDALVAGIDVVIHLAARAHVMHDTAQSPLQEFRRVNLIPTLDLAHAAARAHIRRFVFVSSIGVNGTATTGEPFRETDTPHPSEPYAQSKWEAECALVEAARLTGMQLVRVRPTLVLGAGARGNLERLLRLVRLGVPLPFRAVRNLRSFVVLEDLCELLELCAIHPAAADELFLAASAEEISTPDLLRAMADGFGRPARLFALPPSVLLAFARLVGRDAEVRRIIGSLRVDAAHARTTLGWEGRRGLRESIQAMARHTQ